MIFKFFNKNDKKPDADVEAVNVACLLIHAAKIDENYTSEERKIIKKTEQDNQTDFNEEIFGDWGFPLSIFQKHAITALYKFNISSHEKVSLPIFL